MSDWKSLPCEVLNIIFLYLKKSDKNTIQNKDLSECALTCRGWRDTSQAVFFSDINLRAKNDINKLLHLLLVNNNIKGLIKALRFDGSLEYLTDFAMLFALELQFPNLETLKFSGNNLLYSTFTKMVTENGNFKNLRSFPIPENAEQDQVYLQCINSLKDRVTTIELFDDPNANRNSYSDFREKLNVFPDLEEIVVHTTSTRNIFSEDFMRYLEFIADKKLESLKKVSIVSPSNNKGYCFQLFTLGQLALFSITEPKNIHAIIKNAVYTPLSKAFMLFIMEVFPNTSSFRLEYDFHTIQHLETPSSTDPMAILPFLQHLSVMPNFLLQNIVLLSDETAFKLIKDFYTATEKETTSAKLLRRLEIRSKTYSPLGAVSSNSTTVSFQNINSREQSISLTLNSDYSSQHSNQYNLLFQYLQLPSYEARFQQLVKQVGCFLEMISFEITPNSRFDAFFNIVLTNCSRLNELVISGYTSMSEESFHFIKPKNTCNIKSLTLLGFTSTQKQLINLLDQLPNLETLSLINLFLSRPNPSQELFFSICLPNASLKCLEVSMDDSFSGILRNTVHAMKIVTEDPNQQTLRFFFLTNSRHHSGSTEYSLEDITEDTYQRCLASPGGAPTCLIYCKSLETFAIRYLDANNRQCHNKLDLLSGSRS